MSLTNWSAAFCSPQQYELASSVDRSTVVRDQSVIKLLDGRLRGTIISGLASQVLSYLGERQTDLPEQFNSHRSSQHVDGLDHGVNALFLVHVGRPEHREL